MKEQILILVKTYPTYSKKYFELVCTAGINERYVISIALLEYEFSFV